MLVNVAIAGQIGIDGSSMYIRIRYLVNKKKPVIVRSHSEKEKERKERMDSAVQMSL